MNPPAQARVHLRAESASPDAGIVPQPYSFNPRHRIRFLHPHYRAPTNVLLDLVAPDSTDGGLEYGFAHVACSVIAGNRQDGFFTREVDGTPLQLAHGDIMARGEYYFQFENSTLENPYPVIPTFREWPFPHNDLPSSWADSIQPPSPSSTRSYAPSNLSAAIIAQNVTCRMSNSMEGTETAHLCPRSELEWSRYNQMLRYNTNPILPPDRALDDTANALLLREDLHTQFEAGKFVFVPKKGADTAGTVNIVTHLLTPSQELGMLHHNVQLKLIPNVHPAFLFVRFASIIFQFFEQFLTAGVDRNILGVDGVPKVISGNDCKRFIARTRSQGPTKKSKRALSDNDEGGLVETGVEQRNSQRQRRDMSFRDLGIETLRSPLVGTDTLAASEEERQISQTPSSQVKALREEWLKNERQRSDTESTWAQEQAWVESVWDGKLLMGPHEAKRFWEFHGMETQEQIL